MNRRGGPTRLGPPKQNSSRVSQWSADLRSSKANTQPFQSFMSFNVSASARGAQIALIYAISNLPHILAVSPSIRIALVLLSAFLSRSHWPSSRMKSGTYFRNQSSESAFEVSCRGLISGSADMMDENSASGSLIQRPSPFVCSLSAAS